MNVANCGDTTERILVFDYVTKTRIAPHPNHSLLAAEGLTYLIIKTYRKPTSSITDYIKIEELMGISSYIF